MRYKLVNGITKEEVDGDIVLLIETGDAVIFNETGNEIFDMIQRLIDTDTIIQKIAIKYGVGLNQIQKDVDEFLNNMLEKGIIEVVDE